MTDDVARNFYHYCKDYFRKRHGFTERDAQILLCDPELGKDMDKAKLAWCCENLGAGDDPDDYLLTTNYDAPEMIRINRLLDQYAGEFWLKDEAKKAGILEYLDSIGHPLAEDNPKEDWKTWLGVSLAVVGILAFVYWMWRI